MKNTAIKKLILEILSIIILPVFLILVVLLFDNPQSFITYNSVNALENQTERTVQSQNTSFLNNEFDIYSLDEGTYSVKVLQEEIYVCDEKENNIYKVNARLCDFPLNDRLVLEKGINSLSRSQLYEIISYLES